MFKFLKAFIKNTLTVSLLAVLAFFFMFGFIYLIIHHTIIAAVVTFLTGTLTYTLLEDDTWLDEEEDEVNE
jgi:hypothetical protein